MKSNKLKGKLVEKGKSQEECAKAIGNSLYTFNQKINGKTSFKLEEAEKLGNFLEMTEEEKLDIFLS